MRRLLVEFSHPAQVHKFKHVFIQLQEKGVQILILSRDKEVMLELLDDLALKHVCISRARPGLLGGALELIIREWGALIHTLKFRPNVMLSAHSVAITHIGWLFGIPRLVHEDTEFGTLQQRLYIPFASRVITSTAYYLNWGKKQIRIPSLEPLAYLHPNYFQPDSARLEPYGLKTASRYAVLRVIAWSALHDRGLHGIRISQVQTLIEKLLALGYEKVVLSSEITSTEVKNSRVVRPDPEDLHHLLAFASLCVSESITVSGESAVLGTPTLLINPLRAGHTMELERYGLVERFEEVNAAFDRAKEIASNDNNQAQWHEARKRLLDNKSDMTKAFVNIISNELEQSTDV